jgi:hypothetical protein
MFIYNVTVSVDASVHEDWVQWMKTVHMPDVMKSGCFVDCQLLKVWGHEDLGPTYSAQYRFMDLAAIESYQQEHAPGLQSLHRDRYADKCTAFRTVLEIID